MHLAEENRLDGIPHLMKFFAFSFHELLAITDNSLAMLISDVPGPLDFNYTNIQPRIIQRADNRRRLGLVVESRVCPDCIKEGLMQSVSFHSSIPIACPRHGALPIDFCPKCNSVLTYLRKSLYRCNCGYLLENSPAIERPPWLTTLYEKFAPWHLTHTNIAGGENSFFERDYKAAQLILYILNKFRAVGMTGYINSKNFDAIKSMLSYFSRSI